MDLVASLKGVDATDGLVLGASNFEGQLARNFFLMITADFT